MPLDSSVAYWSPLGAIDFSPQTRIPFQTTEEKQRSAVGNSAARTQWEAETLVARQEVGRTFPKQQTRCLGNWVLLAYVYQSQPHCWSRLAPYLHHLHWRAMHLAWQGQSMEWWDPSSPRQLSLQKTAAIREISSKSCFPHVHPRRVCWRAGDHAPTRSPTHSGSPTRGNAHPSWELPPNHPLPIATLLARALCRARRSS